MGDRDVDGMEIINGFSCKRTRWMMMTAKSFVFSRSNEGYIARTRMSVKQLLVNDAAPNESNIASQNPVSHTKCATVRSSMYAQANKCPVLVQPSHRSNALPTNDHPKKRNLTCEIEQTEEEQTCFAKWVSGRKRAKDERNSQGQEMSQSSVRHLGSRGPPQYVFAIRVEPMVPEPDALHQALCILQLAVPSEDGVHELAAAVLPHLDCSLAAFSLRSPPHELLAHLEKLLEAAPQPVTAFDEIVYHVLVAR